MSKVFSDLPEAIDNTNEIVDKIDLLESEKRYPTCPSSWCLKNFHHRMNTLSILHGKGRNNGIAKSLTGDR